MILATTALVGCGSVHVTKVDPITGSAVQGAADGLRFYLPRPYLAVHEPFVISSTVFLAAGELSPDGNYVLLTDVPESLKALVNPALAGGTQKSMGPISIDATQVAATGAHMEPQGASATNKASGSTTPTGNQTPATDTSKKPSGNGTPSGDQPQPATDTSSTTGGILTYKVTNDNQAFAVTPLPRFFEILWLPDFDEQYVVAARAGFGSASATVNMGQGWSLQGLDAKVDNSAIVKPLLSWYSSTLDALSKLTTAKIEGPLAALSGKPQGAAAGGKAPTAKTAFQAGTPLTVKITQARVVAPGLYKILKPKEIAALKGLSTDDAKRILAPNPPLTDIAFNTYDVLVIEAARPSGDSAFRLGQYADVTTTAGPGSTPDTKKLGGGGAANTQLKSATDALNGVLSQPVNITTDGLYYVAKVSYDTDGKTVLVVLSSTNGGTGGAAATLPAASDLTTLVVSTLQSKGVVVDPKNVTIKP
jgi:hypothetical protein